jgi:signal transduction histidine kinase
MKPDSMNRLRPTLGAAMVFALVLAVGAAFGRQAERLRYRDEHESASQAAAGAAFSLEREVVLSMSATYAVAAVLREQHGRIDDFDALAAQLVEPLEGSFRMLPLYGGLAALQLAPGGVVEQSHPLLGNEAAIGHDLLNDGDRRFEAIEAIRTRRLSVAGPFDLRQGGMGLVGRLPVFLPHEGGERFWGFVNVVIRVQGLVQASRLGQLEEAGYAWELRQGEPTRGGRQRFAGSDRTPSAPVTRVVSVPNGEWELAVAPAEGWHHERWAALRYALALAVAALFTALAYSVLRLPEVLRGEVEARTRELASANAQLAQAQKLESVGRLAGGIAHDFNNLLTVILGCAEALKYELPAGAEGLEAVEDIRAAGRRAGDLTRQLLAFARKQVIAPVPLDLSQLVRGTEKMLRRVLGEDLELVVASQRDPWLARCDPGQMEQVLLNLAVNARDAMPSGGRLTIETANLAAGEVHAAKFPGMTPGHYVWLAIRDSGVGMTAEVKERLFEPFFTTKEPGKGTGLGLATVYGIVTQSGGFIRVESEVGRGSTFEICFPRTLDAPAPAGASPGEKPPRGSETILLVEDDRRVREVTARALRAGGYRVLVAGGGAEALDLAGREAGPLHLIMTDVVMPGLGGRGVADELRERHARARVLFVSGYPQDAISHHGVLDPGVEFLPKPFTTEALLARVRAVLDGR